MHHIVIVDKQKGVPNPEIAISASSVSCESVRPLDRLRGSRQAVEPIHMQLTVQEVLRQSAAHGPDRTSVAPPLCKNGNISGH